MNKVLLQSEPDLLLMLIHLVRKLDPTVTVFWDSFKLTLAYIQSRWV